MNAMLMLLVYNMDSNAKPQRLVLSHAELYASLPCNLHPSEAFNAAVERSGSYIPIHDRDNSYLYAVSQFLLLDLPFLSQGDLLARSDAERLCSLIYLSGKLERSRNKCQRSSGHDCPIRLAGPL